MKALLYVTKRSFINKVKKASKKPLTYLALVAIVAYIVLISVTLTVSIKEGHFGTKYGMLVILTIWTFYSFFMNFSSYGRRKGIIFRPSDAHFVFPSPTNPKVILLHKASWNFVLSLIVSVVLSIAAVFWFHLNFIQVILMFLFLFVFEVMLEGSIIVFLYANEKFSDRTTTWIAYGIYVFLAAVTLVVVLYFRKNGMSLDSAMKLIDYPILRMVPVVGWNIAAFHWILVEGSILNMTATGLYLLTVALVVFGAAKMKCTGGYYEDAAKFADDYAEMKQRKSNGEAVMSIGGKKKFKRASVEYKGTGAKAIFYRQILEYKKEKFFIFGFMTVISIAAAVVVVKMLDYPGEEWAGAALFGVIAYVEFIGTGYIGKWENELKNPYLYLIPDTPAKKLWYATLMEHIKAVIDGAILVIPIGIAWKLPVIQMALGILVYVVLAAIKLYAKVLTEAFVGNTFGVTGKSIARMLFSSAVLGMGAGAGVIGYVITRNMNIVFLVVAIYSIVINIVIALLASSRFAVMEQMD